MLPADIRRIETDSWSCEAPAAALEAASLSAARKKGAR